MTIYGRFIIHNHRIRKLSAEALAALLVASALSGFPLAAHAATANATAQR